jgi:hypothetical protein
MNNTNSPRQKIAIKEIVGQFKFWWAYLFSKKIIIICIAFLGTVGGIAYAWLQKPIYKAELTFAPEDSGSKLGGYMGLAAQFGVNLGMGSGSVFEGDNISELFKSKALITNTLFSKVIIHGKEQTLISYRIGTKEAHNKKLLDSMNANKINFGIPIQGNNTGLRIADSIMKSMIKAILLSLDIDKIDKKLNIVKVAFEDEDEIFARIFVEQLTQNAINYYTEYKSKKAKQNLDILQFQADSVKRMLFGGISDVASLNDLNVNPSKQSARVGSQKRTVDVQVNSAIYTEILKNLEIAKINLRRETPFIQIVDTPYYPLEKKKLGRLFTGIFGGFIFGFLSVLFLVIKKIVTS